ncbi:hypothetical protein V6N13_149200 [Hibiscus sabdariffa]|uniref:Trichome birefringence-like C-terminal domain-containing protein n=1 Tax=Hibiscus sabdariffa TaxID=183260 RepID=A0ABR2EIF7_9ROSI
MRIFYCGREDGLRCFNESKPLKKKNFWGSNADKEMMSVAAGVIGKIKVPDSVLNITQLSMYRVDAHSSIYTYSGGKLLADDKKTDPEEHADCLDFRILGIR